MNKILIHAISDTHNRHDKIKGLTGGDLLIHAGDFSSQGHKWEAERFLEWMQKQPYSAKVLICGNHEREIEDTKTSGYEFRFKMMCQDAGIIYLNDSSVELQFLPGKVFVDRNIPDLAKFKIHGSPVTPWFYSWGWNRARDLNEAMFRQIPEIKPHWDMIPEDTDILVTHGPPYEILDEVLAVDGTSYNLPRYVGCVELRNRIKEIKPDIHIFGHIHCAHGEKHVDGTSFYNASICDEMYGPSNPITVIEYEKEPIQEQNGNKDITQPE